MEKALVVARCRNRLWSVIFFGGLLLWLALISLFHANPIRLVNYRSIYVAESYTQNNIVWSDDASTKGEIGRRFEGLEFKGDESDGSSVEEGSVHANTRGEIGRPFEGVEIKEDAPDRSSVEGGLVHENTIGEIGRPAEGVEEAQEDATDSSSVHANTRGEIGRSFGGAEIKEDASDGSSVEGGLVHANTKGEIGRTFEGVEELREDAPDRSSVEGGHAHANTKGDIGRPFKGAEEVQEEDATGSSSVEGGLVSKTNSLLPSSEIAEEKAAKQDGGDSTSCEGRYIFVYRLPRQFNVDLLRRCRSLSNWTDMCDTLANYGLGPRLPNSNKVLGNTGWYDTNQFSLEVIFHNRMKQYKCLTDDSSVASAIFVPYYAGLDVARYLWDADKSLRDAGPSDLVRWLRRRPEWKVMGGKDHFLVAGRIVWDFRRENEEPPNWGNNLVVLPESMNMTILVLESSLVPKANDFAVPYPTYFHPSKDIEVRQWQRRMRSLRRPYLFSFAGAPRKNLRNSIRNEIISQCRASRRRCNLLECSSRGKQCYNPVFLMKLFQSSTFCLQPPGDSYTRRSAFDSILAGCIPVFFHSGSAYDQYKWHLPADHSRYSVFIPENLVKDGKVALENLLLHIPRKDVSAMQEEVIRLIPAILYADPASELETLEDAFDLSVKGVLERIKRIREEALG